MRVSARAPSAKLTLVWSIVGCEARASVGRSSSHRFGDFRRAAAHLNRAAHLAPLGLHGLLDHGAVRELLLHPGDLLVDQPLDHRLHLVRQIELHAHDRRRRGTDRNLGRKVRLDLPLRQQGRPRGDRVPAAEFGALLALAARLRLGLLLLPLLRLLPLRLLLLHARRPKPRRKPARRLRESRWKLRESGRATAPSHTGRSAHSRRSSHAWRPLHVLRHLSAGTQRTRKRGRERQALRAACDDEWLAIDRPGHLRIADAGRRRNIRLAGHCRRNRGFDRLLNDRKGNNDRRHDQ